MILTIVLVALGQTYWLIRLYHQEFDNLKQGMDAQFRNSFFQLQRIRFLKDSILFNELLDTVYIDPVKKKPITYQKTNKISGIYFRDSTVVKNLNDIKPENIRSIRMINTKTQPLPPELLESIILKAGAKDSTDSIPAKQFTHVEGVNIRLAVDTVPVDNPILIGVPLTEEVIPEKPKTNQRRNPMIQVISNNKTLNDSIPLADVQKYFQKTLASDQQSISYRIIRERWNKKEYPQIVQTKDTLSGFITSPQLSGIQKPFSYQILFPDVQDFLLNQMSLQITGSVLMIFMLITAFVFIYHTMRRQKKLADIKNEFISNITHELKTPISTVHVALEALQNFNVIDNPVKTKEYLNISISELNRLELLVDNVLKRSMFEKESIKLELTNIDLKKLIQQVVQTLHLQFEKSDAHITIDAEGDDFTLIADQLHITSVVYNLLDNAIKYCEEKPVIAIKLKKEISGVLLSIEDKGIGIPQEYRDKIFQPFFRVPNRDRHNTKGYGLGLSYVAQIVTLHRGTIRVSDKNNKGTIFIIQLPIT